MNASASGGTTVTYRRSGVCEAAVDTVAHGLADVFVDMKCFGLGTGSSSIQVTYMSKDGVRHTATATNTASPVAIVACFIGGRAPQTDYPSYFMNMLTQGTQASIVMTKANGSEAIILNFIALMSLVGYGYFFVRISLYLYATARWIRLMPDSARKRQLMYSVVNCSISSVIWTHHRTSMKFVGFLGFIAWHVGTTNSSCQWAANIKDVSQDAVYRCSIGTLGHFANITEVVRLLSYSWVFYALVFMEKMPGIAIYMPGYIVAALLLGFVPLALLAIVVAEICKLRLDSPGLFLIHNQLFLVLVWLAVFYILRTPVTRPYLRFVELCLGWIGVKKQRIHVDSPFYAMLGDHFWIEADLVREEDALYVPLSVLMETKNIKLQNIYDHEYFTYGVLKPGKSVDAPHPGWLASQLEYYVRVHE
ncbi:hypothetical protein ACHHYP_06877 [Achlya hypogyna]|uniref:Transmembrane protein n=1 Tax=Achlya hypogyna TaxID=1202772 RepID=A0A1V9YRC8_ACHHY|nr:hypothetical protein ACHHYP_06877 [Achlya hypogyna]